jgi:PLP dependent protein
MQCTEAQGVKVNRTIVMESISHRLKRIREKIAEAALRSGKNPEAIKIVGVTKTVSPESVEQAIKAGLKDLGGNYIQETLQTIQFLAPYDISWHFIGRLQSNKAKQAVLHFDLIHSTDSEKLAVEIDRQAGLNGKIQHVLIQVKTGQEDTKSGIAPKDAPELVRRISRLENISVRGLMTIPPFFDSPERVRPFFRAMNDLKKRIEDMGTMHVSMETLSMGMTGDFEVAVEEGATLVRIGTAIFGERR